MEKIVSVVLPTQNCAAMRGLRRIENGRRRACGVHLAESLSDQSPFH